MFSELALLGWYVKIFLIRWKVTLVVAGGAGPPGQLRPRAPYGHESKLRWPCHVSGAGYDLVVIKEPTAGQVSVVTGQFAADADVAFARLEAVDGADVVQSSTRHEVAGRRVGARHHPAWA